jgi:hypothetical protein
MIVTELILEEYEEGIIKSLNSWFKYKLYEELTSST